MVRDGPLRLSKRLTPAAFRTYRQRAIFEAGKWDIQINDHCALGDRALVLEQAAWIELSEAANGLAGELLGAEGALLAAVRERRLPGLDRKTRKRLAQLPAGSAAGEPRLIRFDFHLCGERWFVSEANCDVPGGINEASQLSRLWPDRDRDYDDTGDPAAAYVAAVAEIAGNRAVALVHATAFSDDWQLLKYLADRLEARGNEVIPAAPDGIVWADGAASARGTRLGAIVRFFPGDWLMRTRFAADWFRPGVTPVLNPVRSLLAQNKAFPLFLQALGLDAPTWRALLPAVRRVSLRGLFEEDTVLKPVYGRVGEGIAMAGVTPPRKLARWRLSAALFRRHWIAQDRFRPTNIGSEAEPAYPCVGIYTLGTKVIGAYGRVGRRPMIDLDAQDTPVFITGGSRSAGHDPGRTLQ